MLKINKKKFISLTSPRDLVKYTDTLQVNGIEFEFLPESHEVLEPIAKAKQETNIVSTIEYQEIVSNSNLTFYWVSGAKVPSHLRIKLKQLQASQEDSEIFVNAIDLGIKMLKKRGAMHTTLVQNQGTETILLIPSMKNSGVVDIREKIQRSLFCFFNKTSDKSLIKPSRQRRIDHSFSLLRFPYKSSKGNTQLLRQDMSTLLQSWMVENGLCEGSSLQQIKGQESQDVTEVTVTGCAFERNNIIENQLVLDLKHFLILVNFWPYGGTQAHFLIIPHRHIEDWTDLNETEKAMLQKVVTCLTRSIQQNCKVPLHEITTYLLNGIQAGQTVPHSHLHVLTLPEYPRYLIDIYNQLSAAVGSPLSPIEMRHIAKLFAPILYQELLLEQDPRKTISNNFARIPIEELVIIFDLGNVIVDLDLNGMQSQLKKKFGFSNAECQQLFMQNHQLIQDYTVGLINEKNFFQRIAKNVHDIRKEQGGSITASALKQVWNAEIFVTNKSLKNLKMRLDWIMQLKQWGCKILIFSNTNPTHFQFFLSLLQKLKVHAEDYFDDMVVSYKLAKAKPDPTSYLLLLKQRNVAQHRVIFLDDRFENIVGAERAGIKGIHVKTNVLEHADELYSHIKEMTTIDNINVEQHEADLEGRKTYLRN